MSPIAAGGTPAVERLWSCALPTPTLPSDRIRWVIESIWEKMMANPRHAGPRMSAELRAARTLGSKERPIAGDMLSGLIRHHRALERIAAGSTDLLSAWYSLCENGVPDLDDPPNAYAIAVSMPDEVGAEWWERLGRDRAIAHARTLAGRAPVALRVLREGFTLGVPFHRVGAHGLVLDARCNLDIEPAYRDGFVEIQDLGSQAIVDAAGVGPGTRVMDLCAGAGGKSLSLAALGADVQAWDIRPKALDALAERARRARLPVRIAPPRGRYDLVLVDAPCSGTGVLRRHPENRWKFTVPTATQRELLELATGMAPTVLYATCSLLRCENEELVREIAEPTAEQTLWPEADGPDGFYWARMGR